MAESDFAERINIDDIDDAPVTDVMTGDQDRRMYLYYQLVRSIRQAKQIDIIVSFLMESGVKILLSDLNFALNRDAKIRILTGNI